MIWQSKTTGLAALALLLGLMQVACHKGEQAVVGVAKNAVNAEQQAQTSAQAAAQQSDRERVAVARISLPTKSLYVDVRDQNVWANPFLSVGTDTIDLRSTVIEVVPKEPAPKETASRHKGKKHKGKKIAPRPEVVRPQNIVRHQNTQVQIGNLAEALIALPNSAWRYGRVIAVAESQVANPKDRAKVRRNVEATIQKLNDLGFVVQEWPAR